MAQDPVKADQYQVEPGSAGSRLIRKHPTTGALQFLDSVLTGGITLSELAGLRSLTNVLIVAKGGAGAAHTTIQAALDAIPVGASETNPYFVLVGPGVYQETLNLVRNGVTIIGFGAVLQSLAEADPDGVGAYHTLVIQADLGTIPRKILLWGLEITNSHQNFAAVRIVGAAGSNVGSTGIILQDCRIRNTSATGGRTIWADSVNFIEMRGGSFTGTGVFSLLLVTECAGLLLESVADLPGLQLDYDDSGAEPSQDRDGYFLFNCVDVAVGSSVSPPISSDLSGDGKLVFSGCTTDDMRLDGDRTVDILGSEVGDLDLQGTVAVSIAGSKKGTVSNGATASLGEPYQEGTASFAAVAFMAVTFPVPHPDANYRIQVESSVAPASDEQWWPTVKTTAGFRINYTSAQTLDARWTVTRSM